MSKKISGRKIAKHIQENLEKTLQNFSQKPKLFIVYVGEDSIIDNFIRYKKIFGEKIGVEVSVKKFPATITEADLIIEVDTLVQKNQTMIVQLPLPQHINTQNVLNRVPVNQDVDVLSDKGKKLFALGKNPMMPPVAGALVEALQESKDDLQGKNIILFGFGNLVGKPFATWLDNQNIFYEVIDEFTDDYTKLSLLKKADLVVAGAGVPESIQSHMLKEGVILLDAGTSEVGKKIIGDIHPNAYTKASLYTPVPGGIGPITIAVLFQNVFKRYLNR